MKAKDTVVGRRAAVRDVDDRRGKESIEGGRREGEGANPYLAARRTWNDLMAANVASRQMWQLFGVLAMLVALAGVGGVVYIGAQSKFVPYVIQVDKLGQTVVVGTADHAAVADPRVLHASVAAFIGDLRTVTPDVALQRRAVFRTYAMLVTGDPATTKVTEWFSSNAGSNPFKRAEQETVSVDIDSVIAQTEATWQVDWTETVRDREGNLKQPPFRMRALVTVYTIPPTPQTTEEQIRNNPLGIHVRDFSWSKQV